MPERTCRASARKSVVRSRVEQAFAHQKGLVALVVRVIGIARDRVELGLADLTCNVRASSGAVAGPCPPSLGTLPSAARTARLITNRKPTPAASCNASTPRQPGKAGRQIMEAAHLTKRAEALKPLPACLMCRLVIAQLRRRV